MKAAIVWFNQHFSNTWHTLQLLRQIGRPGELRIICSHTRRNYPGKRVCDIFEPEPAGVTDDDYVEFCLAIVRKHHVDLFWPWRRTEAILDQQERFVHEGAKLLCVADRAVFPILNDKKQQYEALQDSNVTVPDFAVVNTVDQFDSALDQLRQRHEVICCKPAVAMFGWGFSVIAEGDQIISYPGLRTPVIRPRKQVRERLKEKEPFSDLLLMPYLPGPERSADCLAHDGKLLRCIIRRKDMHDGYRQIIEKHDRIEAMVHPIAEKFRLNAVFNVQFRDLDGVPYLLEINPRMSGGSPAGSASGLILPYWAIRLALRTATEKDIPHPQTGIEINTAKYPGSL